jgi:hypothetical protein
MTTDSPKPFHVFAVVALKRPGFTESIIALRREEDAARRSARQYMAAMPAAFVRCRVQQMVLTRAEVMAICFRWGQEDAQSGEPYMNTLPGVYGYEYRRGYESVQQAPGTPGPGLVG